MSQYIIKNVIAKYPRIDQTYKWNDEAQNFLPCDRSDNDGAYSMSFVMDVNQAKNLKNQMQAAWNKAFPKDKKDFKHNLKPTEEEGQYEFKAKIKGSYGGQLVDPIRQYDAKNELYPAGFKLTTGSEVNIAVTLHANNNPVFKGVSLRLKAVQVLKLAPESMTSPFDIEDESIEDELEETSPFDNEETVVEEKPPVKKKVSRRAKKEAVVTDELDEEDELMKAVSEYTEDDDPKPTEAVEL